MDEADAPVETTGAGIDSGAEAKALPLLYNGLIGRA